VSLEIIKKRLRALLAPTLPKPVFLAGRRFAESLNQDGSWSDIDYTAPPQWTGWPAAVHLARTLVFAQARETAAGKLDDYLRLAFDFWLGHDFDLAADDERCRSIETPRSVGEITLLTQPDLTSGAFGKAIEILARSRWARRWSADDGWQDWSGENLVASAYNIILRACVESSSRLLGEAFERVYMEIQVARTLGAEGIQADLSYHREGGRLHSGGGGLNFTLLCARFIALGHGTRWQVPPDCMELFAAHLLDGQQWMIRGDTFDLGAGDLGADGQGRSLQPLAAAIDRLAHLANTPRRPELVSLAQRLHGLSSPLNGHRHFWRSDLTVHHRPGFYSSVHMRSARTSNEAQQEEDDLSGAPPHLADGLTCFWRTGAEYQSIYPVWDWQRLPGVTCEQVAGTLPQAGDFVGGVSEGDYGLSVMEFSGPGLSAKKSWFFFDEAVVCMGADIYGSHPRKPVYTSINQCLLNGPVRVVGDNKEVTILSRGEHDLSGAYRAEHDGILYYFPVPLPVVARLGTQRARPSGANGASEPEVREVFNLWIDHGSQPHGSTYTYIVLPVGDDPDAAARARLELGQIDIITNTSSIQAVRHRKRRLLEVAFWQPGMVPLEGGGRIAVNQPCLLICRETPDGVRLSVSNPRNEPLAVHVEYANRCLRFDLPGGENAGRSVSRLL
jgi:chondroitin AC lyase